MKAAGLDPVGPQRGKRFSDEYLIECLRRKARKLGRCPRKADLARATPNTPGCMTYIKRFGSWKKALKTARLEPGVKERKRKRKKEYDPGGRIYTSVTKKLRFAIFERDRFKCVYCGRTPVEHDVLLEIDHVMPESRGGLTCWNNLVTACSDYNQGKSDLVLTTDGGKE